MKTIEFYTSICFFFYNILLFFIKTILFIPVNFFYKKVKKSEIKHSFPLLSFVAIINRTWLPADYSEASSFTTAHHFYLQKSSRSGVLNVALWPIFPGFGGRLGTIGLISCAIWILFIKLRKPKAA